MDPVLVEGVVFFVVQMCCVHSGHVFEHWQPAVCIQEEHVSEVQCCQAPNEFFISDFIFNFGIGHLAKFWTVQNVQYMYLTLVCFSLGVDLSFWCAYNVCSKSKFHEYM